MEAYAERREGQTGVLSLLHAVLVLSGSIEYEVVEVGTLKNLARTVGFEEL